ncbi:BTAD domain-containing putative transcriptional regulator [Dactylosporangium sp. NPDC051485]|uniref:BTAD domain-containing putative transcriptional regulator n=1 Tax=Dactylosporangium sp. NPDC051485 TaxID=3154846 RepID=UPI0034187248
MAADTMACVMLLRVLGPFAVEVGRGGTVDIGGPRQRAVLALLLSARGEAVSVDRMIEDLWRGEPPPRAIASLQAYVSNLRRLLEPDRERRAPARLLVSAPPGYAVRLPPESVDAWRFERLLADARADAAADPQRARLQLRAALELWRGDAYAEFAGEAWAEPEAVRLEELRLAARELLLDVTLRAGAAAEAAAEAELLTRQAPLREESWRLLALALWSAGRQADALAALRRARTVLAEELGLDPGRPLLDLESAILSRREDLLPPIVTAPPTGPAGAALPASAASPRGPAGAALPASVASPTGQAGAALPMVAASPTGPAGGALPMIGASPVSPANAALPAIATSPAEAASAANGSPTLSSSDGDKSEMSGSSESQEVFVGRGDELQALVRAAEDSPQVVLISGEAGVGKTSLLGRFRAELERRGWLVAVGRCPEIEGAPPAWAWVEVLRQLAEAAPPGDLLPVVRPLLEEHAEGLGEQEDVAAGRFRLHRGVAGWLRAAAAQGGGVAVVLDDLHAADGETLMLLAAVAELVERGGPRLLVVGALRPGDNRERLAGTLGALARRSPVRVQLNGLEAPDVARLVRAFARADVDPQTVAALTERTGGNPFYVRESAQLLASEGALVATSDVPEGVRDVLRRRFSRLPPAVVAVLRLAAVVGREADVETLVEAADADEDAVLDALEAGLIAGLLTEPGPGRVRFVHGLVRDTMYTDLSQLRRARMHARVAACTRRLRPDDYPALAYHFARAASSDTAPLAVEAAVRAAELAERRYAYDAAAEVLAGAVDAAGGVPGDRDALRVELLGRLLRTYARAGAVAAARRTRDRAVDVAVAAGREDLLIAAFTSWTVAAPWQIRQYGIVDERTVDLLTRLLRRDDLADADRCRLLDALISELAGEGDPRAAAAGAEALEIARRVGDPGLLALGLTARGHTLPFDRDVARREAVGTELRELAERHGLVTYRWMAEQILGNCAAATNRPARLRASLDRQSSVARTYHLAESFAINLAGRAALAHIEGDFAAAQALYDDGREHMRRQGSLHADGFYFLATATLLISQGRAADYLEPARQAREAQGAIADDGYALALADAGRTAEARSIRIGAHPIRPDYFESAFYTLRALAVVALGRADLAQPVIDALLPVREQLAGWSSTAIVMQPVALTLGRLYRLLGREEAATEHFELAADVAARWNAPHWLAAAKAALER